MGVKLWDNYIRLPQDLVDDPDVNPSLNAIRLLLYLCRHCARLNKTVLRLSQDEILNGRKIGGARVDYGAKLAGPRHLIQAREELIELGWIKFYNLEGGWVYELLTEDEHEQFPKGTAAGSQKELLPVPKRNQSPFLKGTESGSQKELPIRDKELQNNTEQENQGPTLSPASPSNFQTALESVKLSDARQPDLMQHQPALLPANSSEEFNSIEVAHCMCIEFALAGHENKILLDEALKNYRAKFPAKPWKECGEDLIALWAEYQQTVTGKYKRGHKSFFGDGIFLKRAEWSKKETSSSSQLPSAADVLARRRERLKHEN